MLNPNFRIESHNGGLDLWAFQGVYLERSIKGLIEGQFSDTFDKYCLLDRHLALSGMPRYVTRMRTYNIYSLAHLVSQNIIFGCFLHIGISYGTTALIISEMLAMQGFRHREYIFIDPMENDNCSHLEYCNDKSIVVQRWAERAPLTWIEEFCSPSILHKLEGNIAFAHLNSGDDKSELETLPVISQKLSPGGVIIYDSYGLHSESNQKHFDALLEKLDAFTWQLATGQLAIFKKLNSSYVGLQVVF